MITIEYSPAFVKMYRRLPAAIQLLAEKKEHIFRGNPFDPRLKTHKLSGKLAAYWAFWITREYRIVFSFVAKTIIRFHAIGTHGIYQRL